MKSTAIFPMKSFPLKALALIFLIGFSPKVLFGQKSTNLMQLSLENNTPLSKISFDKSNNNLIQHLIHKIHLTNLNTSCHNEIGIFIFKLNNKGKVSAKEIKYMGTLLDSTKDEIIANIKSISWVLKPQSKSLLKLNQWYIFKFSIYADSSKCNDKAAIEILKQIENNEQFYWSAINSIYDNLSVSPQNITFLEFHKRV